MRHIQVTVGTGRFSDTNSFICKFYMQTIFIGGRINGYSFNAHFAAGSDYPQGNFASVGYKYFLKHALDLYLKKRT
jgi:hypothetical protein